ncbi:hypothetical protein BV25DRAFT_1791126 [Artomyces pyxidatus]|uniref:Uncharacterized protein n=1 Tax=Artomyces pyxidatus TaxID=48021 RepID=A0ACB8TKR8_9AGAM|nr:hypothetical protein BV25DRAFT_1791126 [Artomyces pyxidatus]
MAAAPPPNPRASLLAGLRTGGVRSASMAGIPHTAAPGASFNVPRFSSASYNNYPAEEEQDELADMVNNNMYLNAPPRMQQPPMTSAVDGSNNRFQQQQQMNGQRGLMAGAGPTPNTAISGAQRQAQAQQQALQMQMMQLELMRLQAMQAQQYQAEFLAAQAQYQQQNARSFNPPATAGPMNSSFDLRSATLNSQLRRTSQADQLRTQLGVPHEDQVPMTAALGGKFGSRSALLGLAEDDYSAGSRVNYQTPPATPGHTTVISGGTSLGNMSSNNGNTVVPSKSDTAVSWRRGGNNNSVLSGNRAASLTPNVKITPPPTERVSPPPSSSPVRTRPQPLRFVPNASEPLPTVAIDEGTDGEDNSSETSSKSGGSHSSPTTPHSGSSYDRPPLSPREEATKKLYEGLGIGRPVPGAAPTAAPAPSPVSSLPLRVISQAVRQPRGPPSGADELGPRNFATRIRRKAIGGLGVLMDARERRDLVEAY